MRKQILTGIMTSIMTLSDLVVAQVFSVLLQGHWLSWEIVIAIATIVNAVYWNRYIKEAEEALEKYESH